MSTVEHCFSTQGHPVEVQRIGNAIRCHFRPPNGPMTFIFREQATGFTVTNNIEDVARLNRIRQTRYETATSNRKLLAGAVAVLGTLLSVGLGLSAVAGLAQSGSGTINWLSSGALMSSAATLVMTLLLAFLVWPRMRPPVTLTAHWTILLGSEPHSVVLRSHDGDQVNRLASMILQEAGSSPT